MTSDQNMSEVQSHQDQPPPLSGQGEMGQDAGQNVPHGMGQSKSSRRRRRKRKGRGPEGVAIAGNAQGGEQGDFEAAPSVPQGGDGPQPQAARQQSTQAGPGQQQNGSGTGTKRWKKKFRERDRGQRPADNPGNQASGSSNVSSNGHSNGASNGSGRDRDTHQFGNNGFKQRKGGGGGGGKQQRGPRSFVGPMDHSYRVVNGNFAETPPSTIEPHGNYGHRNGGGRGGYQSDSQPIDYSQGKTIPIPEDAQTKIFFFIDDLFFVAKIQETARKLGVKVEFVKNDKESVAKLTGVEESDRPALIVFDLNNASAKPMTLIPKLKTKFKKSTSIVGFLSHLQGDLKAKAVEAGCDSVMPRAAFSQNLPNLLRRYGIVEEDEANYNM